MSVFRENKSKGLSDKEMLIRFKDKNSRNYAFDLLCRKYQQQIYFHIRRMLINHDDSNDVTQEVFIKIWKNLDKFREDSNLFTWIYRIATNETFSFLRKKRKKLFIPMVDVEKKLSDSLTSDSFFDSDEIQMKLQKAILKLPTKQRTVFNMRYFEEMPYLEMSEILDTSVGALKASYHIAVKKIKNILTED